MFPLLFTPGNGPLVTDCKPGRISHQDPFPGTRPADEEIGGSSNQGRMTKIETKAKKLS